MNRYANLVGTNRISDEYPKITEGFDKVQEEMDAATAGTGDVQGNLDNHEADDIRHWTESDRDSFVAALLKLAGIQEGAEVNQFAFSVVNGLEADAPLDSFDIAGGTGITVSLNPITKTITITATGSSTPGAHGSSHTEFGADPVPNATDTEGGLLSAEDKARLDTTLTVPFTWGDLEG